MDKRLSLTVGNPVFRLTVVTQTDHREDNNNNWDFLKKKNTLQEKRNKDKIRTRGWAGAVGGASGHISYFGLN